MTVQARFFDWSRSGLNWDAPPWESCSPNLRAIDAELNRRWGKARNLGCHHDRNIVGGGSISTHAYGAALDWRWGDVADRAKLLDEIIPWLVSNSAELGVQAIHDYAGDCIWRPPGTSGRSASGSGWKIQNGAGGQMGKSSSVWLHIETHRDSYFDATPVVDRLGTTPTTARPVDLIDISDWQTITRYDSLPEGVPVVHRAVTNVDDLDDRFTARMPRLSARTDLFGAYVVLAPGKVKSQMRRYQTAMTPHWRDGAFTQLDVEPWDGIGVISADELDRAIAMHDDMFGADRLIVYMNPSVVPELWAAFVERHPTRPRWVPGYRDDDHVKAERFGATVHQWTDRYRHAGFTGPVDANEICDMAALRRIANLDRPLSEEIEMRVFFTPASDKAQWYTTDGVTAHRLTGSHARALAAAGRLPEAERLTVEQAELFSYVVTAEAAVIGVS